MTELFPADKIKQLQDLIADSKNITIITHVNPDGDAVGSSVGWQTFLKEQGVKSTVIVPNHFPNFLKWIKGSENIVVNYSEREKCENLLKNSDLIFCLDFNNLSRLNSIGQLIQSLDTKKVLIDHHVGTCENDFTLTFSKVPLSSTSEAVYEIIRGITKQTSVSQEIAEALYAGIMTDTGEFSHSCNSCLFRTVADLMDCGIDRNRIHSLVYGSFSENRMRLQGYCIHKKMEVLPEYKTAYISLTLNELDKFKFEPGDTEGFVNIPLNIKDIELSAFFVESKEGFIKVSLRSTGEFSVDSMARKYFNGGGHKNASGGKLYTSLDKAVSIFKSILPEYDELSTVV
ncbi:MAG: bifunctional oligoribonuclease/PAP phosphatase NrnA [Prevotellaceae bacterium]|jgi:phosphoesterase RecJ-like protein|nr:bifunctional oligoribonuclease/PAP phosphatase NrnA [Prevotellaceae bacterium]